MSNSIISPLISILEECGTYLQRAARYQFVDISQFLSLTAKYQTFFDTVEEISSKVQMSDPEKESIFEACRFVARRYSEVFYKNLLEYDFVEDGIEKLQDQEACIREQIPYPFEMDIETNSNFYAMMALSCELFCKHFPTYSSLPKSWFISAVAGAYANLRIIKLMWTISSENLEILHRFDLVFERMLDGS